MDIDILGFIKNCIRNRRINWTYHVNMRLKGRYIKREVILSSIDSYKIIEKYPEDKYLPSFLVYTESQGEIFHIHIAVDLKDNNIRIITVYRPTLDKWEEGFKMRRKS